MKQPFASLMPLLNVDVAPPVWFMASTSSPPARVDVAVVVPVKYEATISPCTDSGA